MMLLDDMRDMKIKPLYKRNGKIIWEEK